ncbi:MAG: endonuclease III [Candidatus Dojkabacteria bacterium]|nr:MAG: endonuclease III [Candidatus Dojkabacteria bacterium]
MLKNTYDDTTIDYLVPFRILGYYRFHCIIGLVVKECIPEMQEQINSAIKILAKKYGNVHPFLKHQNAFEFIIAVILSAQTTDNLVNKVTPDLFSRFPDPETLANAKIEDVARIIKSINYYKTKARNIIQTAQILNIKFQGKVPDNMDDLLSLPGVGRKVANVILSDYYKKPQGFVVDTHIKRVSYRLGWTKHTNPEKIERDLIHIIPKKYWTSLPKQLIALGREYCHPKNPDCSHCPLTDVCQKNLLITTKKLNEYTY